MTLEKKVAVMMDTEDYEYAVEFKKTHGRPTWREMIMDYVAIKKAEEQGDVNEF